MLGRDPAWLQTFIPAIKALTLEDLKRAIKRHLTPDDVVTTVVCMRRGSPSSSARGAAPNEPASSTTRRLSAERSRAG